MGIIYTLLITLFSIIAFFLVSYGILTGTPLIKVMCISAIFVIPSIFPALWIKDIIRNNRLSTVSGKLALIGSLSAIVILSSGLIYFAYKVLLNKAL
jgi:hypothetical protein